MARYTVADLNHDFHLTLEILRPLKTVELRDVVRQLGPDRDNSIPDMQISYGGNVL